jgi:hypothetical protein
MARVEAKSSRMPFRGIPRVKDAEDDICYANGRSADDAAKFVAFHVGHKSSHLIPIENQHRPAWMTRITQCHFPASTGCGDLNTIAEAPTVSTLAPRHPGMVRGRDTLSVVCHQ